MAMVLQSVRPPYHAPLGVLTGSIVAALPFEKGHAFALRAHGDAVFHCVKFITGGHAYF